MHSCILKELPYGGIKVLQRQEEGEILSWEEYVAALSERFGSKLHHYPMVKLRNLKQQGSVQTYLSKFEELLNRVYLTDDYIVSFFLNWLKDKIQYTVRMFRPASLQQAIGLAKL